MKQYSYQVLRYMPDQVSGEFANVGLVMFNQEEKFFKMAAIEHIGRIKQLFRKVESRIFIAKLTNLTQALKSASQELFGELNYDKIDKLDSLTTKVLPKDNSSLYFTEVKKAIDVSLDKAFSDLYSRLIHQEQQDDNGTLKDRDVWSQIYKNYFDSKELNHLIIKRSIKTKGDDIHFDHAIKNGRWNYLEPVTFDLSREISIKDKVYRWVGRFKELDSSDEQFKLYLLSKLPSDPQMKTFIRERLDNKKHDNFEVVLVKPNEIDEVVEQLKTEVEH